jgi:hypothetical protein
MSEYGISPEFQDIGFKPDSLELVFGQLRSDYGSAEYLDDEAVEKIDEVRSELEKLMAPAKISWDTAMEKHQQTAIKNLILGTYASENPAVVAQEIVEFLKKI